MAETHLRRWRIVGLLAVLGVWVGAAINAADGTAGWLDLLVSLLLPPMIWISLWSSHSGLVRNAERRRAARPDRIT